MKKNNKVLVDVKNTIGIIKTEMNLHQKTSLEGIFDHACTFLPLKVLCTISRLDICPYVRTYGISSTVAAWSFNLHLSKLVRSSASYKRRLFSKILISCRLDRSSYFSSHEVVVVFFFLSFSPNIVFSLFFRQSITSSKIQRLLFLAIVCSAFPLQSKFIWAKNVEN